MICVEFAWNFKKPHKMGFLRHIYTGSIPACLTRQKHRSFKGLKHFYPRNCGVFLRRDLRHFQGFRITFKKNLRGNLRRF